MKNLRLVLILYFLIAIFVHTNASIASVAVITGTEGKDLRREKPVHRSPDSIEKGTASSASHVAAKGKPVSHKTEAEQISELTSHYQSQGMTSVAAMLKVAKEIRASKETPLEKELRELGCVQWGEIEVLTRGIVDEVKGFYNPDRGPFILKPGLQIVYENEVS